MTTRTIPGDEIQENSKAFKILNSDNLIGQFGKPNAIVRPVRRGVPSNGGGGGENVGVEAFDGIRNGRRNLILDSIESQVIATNKTLKSDTDTLGNFSKQLDYKLKLLQKDHKNSSKNSSNGDTIQKRPLFITTVPTGIFLQPTREHPVPTAHRTYAFFSMPKIFANKENNYGESGYRVPSPLHHQHLQQIKTNNLKSHQRLRDNPQAQNIMYDKRVVRGSNYSQNNMNSGADGDNLAKEEETRRRQLLRKRYATRTQRSIIGTPPPIRGRKHEQIQTEKYLEELHCRPAETNVQCQTDLFLHRPPTPPFIPPKVGVDADTEILNGELFQFDIEVQPLIDTLVGRSVEQSLVEVIHEEEIADMKRQQQEFLAQRELEAAELRRLESEEIRLQSEKDRRLQQEAIARDLDKDMEERITAAKLLQGHIATLIPGVLNKIEPYVEAANREQLERSLGPWLANEVAEEVGQMIDSRDLLEEIVREILEERAGRYVKIAESENMDLDEEENSGKEGKEESEGEEEEEEGTGENIVVAEEELLLNKEIVKDK